MLDTRCKPVQKNHKNTHVTCLQHVDEKTGLRLYIALSHTEQGPAIGGCRWMPYVSDENAQTDAIDLANAMFYKASFHALPHGGGKAVLIKSPANASRSECLRAFAHCVDQLKGAYITAIDMGTSNEDMRIIRTVTPYVIEENPQINKITDPSYYTALGVKEAIKAAVQHTFKTNELTDIRIAIQGIGKTGALLTYFLLEAGAKLWISDINPSALAPFKNHPNVTLVSPDKILYQPVDVLAPCAIGSAIHDENIQNLKTTIIVPAANNPLATPNLDTILKQNKILYVPDFVSNAGGLILASGLYRKQSIATIERNVREINKRCLALLKESQARQTTPLHQAIQQLSPLIQ
jgi:leucine dehydrogenase